MDALTIAASRPPVGSLRRIARRAQGLVLGLALPTGFLTWLLGFGAIKERINRRVWCSDATDAVLQVTRTRSGAAVRSSSRLVCMKGDAALRSIGDARMLATNIVVAFCISLALAVVLAGVVSAVGRLRRPARAS